MTDPDDQFLSQLDARSRQHLGAINAGEITKGYIALDLISSMFSAYEGGLSMERVIGALPVTSWRESTMPVPVAFLRVLSEAWGEYLRQQDLPQGKTLGQCLQVEAQQSGHRGAAKLTRTRDRARALSNRVAELLLEAEAEGQTLKQIAAIAQVAQSEGVSQETVRNAFRKFGQPNMARYRQEVKRT